MSILIGGFLVFFGIVWTGILFLVQRTIPSQAQGANAAPFQIMLAVGAVVFAIGALLLVTGLIRRGKLRRKAMDIFQRGIATQGTVTFVDKNYKFLVNNKPVYSIIEFTFKDDRGTTHTARKDTVESDLVIRCKIEVGSQVDLKFLREKPEDNVLLMRDPAAG